MRIRTLGSFPLVLAMVAFPAAGCNDSPTEFADEANDLRPGHPLLAAGAGVTLGIEADALAPGAPVSLILENGSGDRVGHNLCFHVLERRSGGEWEVAPEHGDRICITILYILESGASFRYETELPAELPAGEYRFRAALYLIEDGEHRDVATEPFSVG